MMRPLDHHSCHCYLIPVLSLISHALCPIALSLHSAHRDISLIAFGSPLARPGPSVPTALAPLRVCTNERAPPFSGVNRHVPPPCGWLVPLARTRHPHKIQGGGKPEDVPPLMMRLCLVKTQEGGRSSELR
jgi:hypothetical protein